MNATIKHIAASAIIGCGAELGPPVQAQEAGAHGRMTTYCVHDAAPSAAPDCSNHVVTYTVQRDSHEAAAMVDTAIPATLSDELKRDVRAYCLDDAESMTEYLICTLGLFEAKGISYTAADLSPY